MSVPMQWSSAESSATSGLDTALTLRLPGSDPDPDCPSPTAAASDSPPSTMWWAGHRCGRSGRMPSRPRPHERRSPSRWPSTVRPAGARSISWLSRALPPMTSFSPRCRTSSSPTSPSESLGTRR